MIVLTKDMTTDHTMWIHISMNLVDRSHEKYIVELCNDKNIAMDQYIVDLCDNIHTRLK